MLAAVNNGASWTGAEFNILRVVTGFPLAANFKSSSQKTQTSLGKDKHPLATLSNARLIEVLNATPGGKSIVDQLTATLKRAREGLEETDDERPQAKRSRR
jgi:hypothetical protein